MLVLSRRAHEKIVFPTLGITLEVCCINKNAVRLGIDAPPSIPILRQEISPHADRVDHSEHTSTRHQLRNRLHMAILAIHLAQKQLQAGLNEKADESLAEALREFATLEEGLAAEKANEAQTKRAIRALLVEDNCNESTLLAEFLRLHGIKVETAYDGQEALDFLKSHDRPDVVLLDMHMPRCDGPTTITAIRQDAAYEGLKVFAVSGDDSHKYRMETGSRGVDGWFTKPVNPTKIIHEINRSICLN